MHQKGLVTPLFGQTSLYKAMKSFLEGKDVFVTRPTDEEWKILVLCMYAILPVAFDDMYGHVAIALPSFDAHNTTPHHTGNSTAAVLFSSAVA